MPVPEKLEQNPNAAGGEKSLARVQKAGTKKTVPLKEPVALYTLLAFLALLGALILLVKFLPDILGKKPSKNQMILAGFIVLTPIMLAQVYFLRKAVFSPAGVDKILGLFK